MLFLLNSLINSMHSSLQFTMESEENDRLPFLDVLTVNSL